MWNPILIVQWVKTKWSARRVPWQHFRERKEASFYYFVFYGLLSYNIQTERIDESPGNGRARRRLPRILPDTLTLNKSYVCFLWCDVLPLLHWLFLLKEFAELLIKRQRLCHSQLFINVLIRPFFQLAEDDSESHLSDAGFVLFLPVLSLTLLSTDPRLSSLPSL